MPDPYHANTNAGPGSRQPDREYRGAPESGVEMVD